MEDAFGDLDAQIAEEDEFLHACDLGEPMEEDIPSSVLPLMASQHDMRDEGDMHIPDWLKFSQGDVAEEGPSAFACTPPLLRATPTRCVSLVPRTPPVSVVGSQVGTSAPRRRLRGKQPDTQGNYSRAGGVGGRVCETRTRAREPSSGHAAMTERIRIDWATEDAWEASSQGDRYKFFRYHVTKFWARTQGDVPVQMPAEILSPQTSKWQRNCWSRKRRCFQLLPVKEREAVAVEWARQSECPAYVACKMTGCFLSKTNRTKLGCCALLTYIGPWMWRDSQGQEVDTSAMSLQECVEALRKSKVWQEEWSRMLELGVDVTQILGGCDHAVCLEICPNTFTSEGRARLHLHLYVRGLKRLSCGTLDDLSYGTVKPVLSNTVGGLTTNSRARACYSGMFYCSIPKAGQMWSFSTRLPFKDYLVQGSWIVNLLQSQKLSLETARELLGRTCNSQARFAREIQFLEQQEEKAAIRRMIQEAEEALRGSKLTFREIPMVREWERQYEEHSWRYKLLVLEGASRTGKTLFARSLVPDNMRVFELNSCSGHEPDLRGFRTKLHGLCIFDELSPHTMAAHRKLFQGAPCEVSLGHSGTNMYAYSVCLYRVRLVACSNVWSKQLLELCEEDRDWVVANTMHYLVDAPLWLETGVPMRQSIRKSYYFASSILAM